MSKLSRYGDCMHVYLMYTILNTEQKAAQEVSDITGGKLDYLINNAGGVIARPELTLTN